jgi:hypothetical protein
LTLKLSSWGTRTDKDPRNKPGKIKPFSLFDSGVDSTPPLFAQVVVSYQIEGKPLFGSLHSRVSHSSAQHRLAENRDVNGWAPRSMDVGAPERERKGVKL